MSVNQDDINKLKQENEALKNELAAINKGSKKRFKRKLWLAKKGINIFVGYRLKESIKSALEELETKKKLSKDTIADLTASVFWRLTRIGVIATFIALMPSVVLVLQTLLINNQNELFKNQNKRIEQQTHLLEASRRSSQMFIMGEVLSDINKELENKIGKERVLSDVLVGRILSLAEAMKPYRYLEGDTLIKKPLSPERGQLLISLIESKMDTIFFINRILKRAKLSYSDLGFTDLKFAYIRDIDLRDANLFDADLSYADLSDADLRKVSLLDVKLDSTFVHRKDWLVYIKDSLKLNEAKELYDKYRVIENEYGWYMIVKKNSKTNSEK